ncbi:MAG: alpha/beta hydrolase [Oscillospiraceae bacterium]|nr:alpha/beta hydrolase [Oscillospiraceae bacterium]
MDTSHITMEICSVELISAPDHPWMVMIHGFGGSRHMWKRQVEEFKHDYNLMILELPGHGDSIHGAADHPDIDIVEIAKRLVDHIHEKGIEKADFLCVSLGSLVMSAIVDICPELVRSVLLCGAIFGMKGIMKLILNFGNVMKIFLPYMVVIRLLAWVLMPKHSHKVSRKFLVMECKKLGRKEFHKWYGILCSELRRLKNNIEKFIPLNAFVVMGREDFVFIQPALETMKDYAGKIQFTVMEQCGHVCSLQKWREFNVIASDFFRGAPGLARHTK